MKDENETKKKLLLELGYRISRLSNGNFVIDDPSDEHGFIVECPTEEEAVTEGYNHRILPDT